MSLLLLYVAAAAVCRCCCCCMVPLLYGAAAVVYICEQDRYENWYEVFITEQHAACMHAVHATCSSMLLLGWQATSAANSGGWISDSRN
jgi:hypothetical protein